MRSKNIKPPPAAEGVIELTDRAKAHFDLIRKGASPYCVRIGVKKGGCSGMSYTMDVIDESKLAVTTTRSQLMKSSALLIRSQCYIFMDCNWTTAMP